MIPLHLKEWDDMTNLSNHCDKSGVSGMFFDDPCLACLKNKVHKTRWECEKHTLAEQESLRWKTKIQDFVDSLESIRSRNRRIPA